MLVKIGRYPGRRSKRYGEPPKMTVRVDNWDVWNLDYTLSQVIYPALVKLKEQKMGSPYVDDEDVPENLREADVHEKWNWVLDEMIWAFRQKAEGDWEEQYYTLGEPKEGEVIAPFEHFDREGWLAHQKRITNGFRLFGRYYEGLWD